MVSDIGSRFTVGLELASVQFVLWRLKFDIIYRDFRVGIFGDGGKACRTASEQACSVSGDFQPLGFRDPGRAKRMQAWRLPARNFPYLAHRLSSLNNSSRPTPCFCSTTLLPDQLTVSRCVTSSYSSSRSFSTDSTQYSRASISSIL